MLTSAQRLKAMKIILENPDNKAAFFLEMLKSIAFLKKGCSNKQL